MRPPAIGDFHLGVVLRPFQVAAARATMNALANMDRRELADIGLNPSDVRLGVAA